MSHSNATFRTNSKVSGLKVMWILRRSLIFLVPPFCCRAASCKVHDCKSRCGDLIASLIDVADLATTITIASGSIYTRQNRGDESLAQYWGIDPFISRHDWTVVPCLCVVPLSYFLGKMEMKSQDTVSHSCNPVMRKTEIIKYVDQILDLGHHRVPVALLAVNM